MFKWKLSKVWWTKSQLTLDSEWFSRGNVGFSQSGASLVVMVAANWLSASSWGPGPPLAIILPSFGSGCVWWTAFATHNSPAFWPDTHCLSEQSGLCICMGASFLQAHPCMRVCVCAQATAPFAASPHELWLTAVSMSEVRARLAMLSFTVTGTSLVCACGLRAQGLARCVVPALTLCPRSRPVPSFTLRKSKLNKWPDRCSAGETPNLLREAQACRKFQMVWSLVEKFWVCLGSVFLEMYFKHKNLLEQSALSVNCGDTAQIWQQIKD